MDNNNNSVKQIDVTAIIKAMIKNRKAYFIGLPVSFILSILIIMCVPRHYKSTAKLAPELSSFSSGSLGELASSFGFDIGSSSSNEDAIFPELYPDLIESNDFLTSLFDVKVKSLDGSINTSYYDYLATKQEYPWWTKVTNRIKLLFAKRDTTSRTSSIVNPFRLTKSQDQKARSIANKVSCTVDKNNYLISISVEAQDPLICATLTDTVQARLQQFITDYSTSKAR